MWNAQISTFKFLLFPLITFSWAAVVQIVTNNYVPHVYLEATLQGHLFLPLSEDFQ